MPRTAQLSRNSRQADILAQIQHALPEARAVVAAGLEQFEDVIGSHYPKTPLSDRQLEEVTAWTDRTFALGVAVGLLLNARVLDVS